MTGPGRATRLVSGAGRYIRAGRKAPYPLVTGFAVNNTCNTFCKMCDIWKIKPKQQLSLEQIEQIFSNPIFKQLLTVSLTGGEPSLRRDLGEIPHVLGRVLPGLMKVNLTTNAYAADKLMPSVERMIDAGDQYGFKIGLGVSIDGVGDVHDTVRGNPGAFKKTVHTLDLLQALRKKRPFDLSLACTLSKFNLHDAHNVLEFAEQRKLFPVFRKATVIDRVNRADKTIAYIVDSREHAKLKNFITYLLKHEYQPTQRRVFYEMLNKMLDGGERSVPCLYNRAGLFIDYTADVYVCSVRSKKLCNALSDDLEQVYKQQLGYRDDMQCDACKGCDHDISLYLAPQTMIMDFVKSRVTGIRR